MKLSIETINKIAKISNSIYDKLKIDFIYNSNKLEGSTFSKQNLSVLLEHKKVLGEHFVDDIIETKNSLELFDKVIDTLNEPLDKHLLWEWHRILKKGSVDDEIGNIGKWKKYSNTLSNTDLKLCPPTLVDSYMFNLLEDAKNWKNDIESIADFHQKFEHIHPFQDGNGRIGRFIILRQCITNNIDLIAIDNRYNQEYRKALYTAQTTNNLTPLVSVFKKCQKRLDEKLDKFIPFIQEIEDDRNNEG